MTYCQIASCPRPFAPTTAVDACGIVHVCDPCLKRFGWLVKPQSAVNA